MATLGERLTADGRRLIDRRGWQPSWLFALDPLLTRVAALPTPSTPRFSRVEAPSAARAAASSAAPHQPGNATDESFPPPHPPESARDRSGEQLPAVVQQRLAGLVGSAAAGMRVHRDAAADALARAHAADAVAVGHDVYFRAGRYRPHDRDGLALVAHEALHVEESTGSASTWRRATADGVADEERRAEGLERALSAPHLRPAMTVPAPAVVPLALRPVPVTAVVPAPRPAAAAGTGAAGTAAPAPGGGGHAMTAAVGRDLDAPTADASPAFDIEELRRSLYHDMIGQLRTELERGA